MAEDKNIAISIEVKGTEQSIESVKDLKAAIKAAKDEQIKAAQVFGESSKEFIEASKNVSKLKDKVEDLNDSTQSLKGSGVERASAGFNQLGEGLRNLDFDKVKVGLVAMKSALAAVGIGLIVQAVTYLVENFEELSKGSGLLAQALQFIGTIVNGLKDYFLKFGDILQGINPELRGMSKEIDNLKDSMNELLSSQMSRIERLTALAKANGESTVAYENLKQEAIIKTNKLVVEQIMAFVKAGGILDDEKKKLLTSSLQAIQNARTEQAVIEITAEKTKNDKSLAVHKEHKAKMDAENKVWESESEAAFQREMQHIRDEQAAKDAARFAEEQAQLDLEARQVAQDEAMIAGTQERNRLAAEAKLEQDNAAREKDAENQKMWADNSLAAAGQLTSSLSSLSDSYFYFKRKNLEKGSAEDLKQAKKQFDINKGLAIASATISGIQGVVNALSAQSIIPEPYGTVLKVVTAAAVGAAAVANIAKIASSKFDAGGGGGGGGGAATASIAIPAPPSISTAENNVNKGTSFDETGKKIGGESKTPTVQVKATIGVDEVSNKQNRVDTLEKQSTF
jgi:hypothetical protein